MPLENRETHKYLDFGQGADEFTVSVKPGRFSGRIVVALDRSWNQPIGSVDVPAAGSGSASLVISGEIAQTSGRHSVWLQFFSNGGDSFKVEWFQFQSHSTTR